MTWILGSASTHATRRAGPGPQDDMFLSFFILRFFSIVIPGRGVTSVFRGGLFAKDCI